MSHCPCDKQAVFTALQISPGLSDLKRQVGGFPQFRRAMLTALREHTALDEWNARDDDDLGVMLLEMWAYVCDVLTFYDEVIANESYLRTADQRASLRKLTGQLGYVPRPAVASSVLLTAFAEGRKALNLDSAIAFRSEAFADQPPQVFELDIPATIHPLNNQWRLDPQRDESVGAGSGSGGAHAFILLTEEQARLKKQDVVLISTDSGASVHSLQKRSEVTGDDQESYVRLDLDPALNISSTTKLEDVTLATPSQSVGLWSMGSSPTAIPSGQTQLILDGLYRQLKAGQSILVSKGNEYRWFEVAQVNDTMMDATAGGEYTVTNSDDESVTLSIPVAQAPATRLTLDTNLNNSGRRGSAAETWNNSDASQLIVHYAMIPVGELTRQRDTSFDENSDLKIAPARGQNLETPYNSESPSLFVLQDVNEVAVNGNGSLDYQTGELDFQGSAWADDLTPPVAVFGNVLQVSRGATVNREVLGSGDAAVPNQGFTLKKTPLTYVPAPTSGDERGVSSTLTIWVDGVQWTEVATFYGQDEHAEVYILRQNDGGETRAVFGDGKRGRRLPSGTDNVIASYRHGAGAAAPPANTIKQLAKPVKGLTSISNPFAASGGDDAESADGIRDHAPQSALLLGRAVSLDDFMAAAAGMSGVVAVAGEWRWNNRRQRPVVQIWFIGDSDPQTITTNLRNLSDPAIALDVKQASATDLKLSLDVTVDDRYIESEVLNAVRSKLTDSATGLLAPANIGIGKPLYRSRVFEAVLATPGTVSVTHMTHDEVPFQEVAVKPDAGHYFDLANGGLLINGKESFDD